MLNAAPRWPPWSRHPPRCARPSPDPPRRSAPGPSQTPPCGLHGAGARGSVTARNGPAPVPASPTAGTPVATGNPSSATPAHAQSRYPRSSPPGAYGSSARVAPKAPPSWPRNRAGRPPRRSRRSRPRSVPTAGGRKIHDLASAASPTSPPSSPPDDPSAVPSPSANPPVKSEHQRIRPGRLRPVPTSSTGCYDALAPEFNLARKLIAARAAAGLSQAEVAKRMGTKQSEISRIEGARQNISIEKLSRFADAVGTKLDIRLDPV